MSKFSTGHSLFKLPRQFTDIVKGFSAPFALWLLHVPIRILSDAGEGITPFLGNRVLRLLKRLSVTRHAKNRQTIRSQTPQTIAFRTLAKSNYQVNSSVTDQIVFRDIDNTVAIYVR